MISVSRDGFFIHFVVSSLKYTACLGLQNSERNYFLPFFLPLVSGIYSWALILPPLDPWITNNNENKVHDVTSSFS